MEPADGRAVTMPVSQSPSSAPAPKLDKAFKMLAGAFVAAFVLLVGAFLVFVIAMSMMFNDADDEYEEADADTELASAPAIRPDVEDTGVAGSLGAPVSGAWELVTSGHCPVGATAVQRIDAVGGQVAHAIAFPTEFVDTDIAWIEVFGQAGTPWSQLEVIAETSSGPFRERASWQSQRLEAGPALTSVHGWKMDVGDRRTRLLAVLQETGYAEIRTFGFETVDYVEVSFCPGLDG